MEFQANHLWTLVLATLWCAAHSLAITHTARDGLRRLFPRYHVFYRLLYVVISSASLVLLFAWLRTLPETTWWDWPGWWGWVRWLGLTEAVVLFWLGANAYEGRRFLGLAQIRDYLASREPPALAISTTGILGVIRHPWYTGTLVFLAFCLPLTDINVLWRLVFAAYVLVGTELEERKLLRDLGPIYAEYRRDVPRFFPNPLRRRR